MFIFINNITSIINYYIINMRRRISRGILVGSTNPLRKIKAKRLVIEVLYNFRNGIVRERTIDIRETINQ